jgi:hypothetical protein
MLLAEELALVAIKPDKGRAALGTGDNLNACLAGLLVAELLVAGAVEPGESDDRIVTVPGRAALAEPVLAAAAEVVAEKGPKLKAVLSHMSRGQEQRLGVSTREAVLSSLAAAGILGPSSGLVSKRTLLNPAARDAIVGRLRAAAADDTPMEPRTALVLSMTGPAQLLEVVAPDRSTRKHARQRIDHALDGSDLDVIGKIVRRLVEEAAAVAAGAS